MAGGSEGRIVRLVRHGHAAAGWGSAIDPGLDDVGLDQAAAVARRLAEPAPAVVVTSPLRRCRVTAQALADLVAAPVVVAPEVSEIPSPDGVEMDDRVEWLRRAMQGTWTDLGPRYTAYRDRVSDFVLGRDDATVIFSHFVAINAVIGACLGSDRLVLRRLDHCSITTVVVGDDGRHLVEGGHEADTLIR